MTPQKKRYLYIILHIFPDMATQEALGIDLVRKNVLRFCSVDELCTLNQLNHQYLEEGEQHFQRNRRRLFRVPQYDDISVDVHKFHACKQAIQWMLLHRPQNLNEAFTMLAERNVFYAGKKFHFIEDEWDSYR